MCKWEILNIHSFLSNRRLPVSTLYSTKKWGRKHPRSFRPLSFRKKRGGRTSAHTEVDVRLGTLRKILLFSLRIRGNLWEKTTNTRVGLKWSLSRKSWSYFIGEFGRYCFKKYNIIVEIRSKNHRIDEHLFEILFLFYWNKLKFLPTHHFQQQSVFRVTDIVIYHKEFVMRLIFTLTSTATALSPNKS